MEAQNQAVPNPGCRIPENRHQPRFKFDVDVKIDSKTSGVLKGHTVDISESGISAMLRLEVPLGELVELHFSLPFGPVHIYAMVRQRSAFRYGFQFADSQAALETIKTACRSLALEQSLFG
jgi:hypothetical protein